MKLILFFVELVQFHKGIQIIKTFLYIKIYIFLNNLFFTSFFLDKLIRSPLLPPPPYT